MRLEWREADTGREYVWWDKIVQNLFINSIINNGVFVNLF